MNYLVDTNHWSYIQRKQEQVLARIEKLPDDAILYMPVVAQAELLLGVELVAEGKRKNELKELYERTLSGAVEILLIDSAVAERFAAIFTQLKRSGRPIETNDIWIAAIAMRHDAIVVTNDVHFREIKGLRVEDWSVVS